jgi:hypothetical protein
MGTNWNRTSWKYETSEDSTVSVLASVSWGRFILRNAVSSDTMAIKYKCLSAGLSKGLPVGYTESSLKNESNGTYVYALGYFNQDVFPCGGYIAGVGATLGVLDSDPENNSPDTFANGGAGGVVIFEVKPFARFACWGEFRATTPGAGVSLGIAYFSLDS